MRIVSFVFYCGLIAIIPLSGLLGDHPAGVFYSQLLAWGFFGAFVILALDGLRKLATRRLQQIWYTPKGRRIVVDGSNVMHWGGDPSLKVLQRVLNELAARGYAPTVYFDANVGYKLFDHATDASDMARRLDMDRSQVILAPSRIPADGIILERASRDGLQVVTNDRFLDWKGQFPQVGRNGFLVKGRWQQGSVMLRGIGL